MIEKGLKLRTKLESCSTLKAFVAPEAYVLAGAMVLVGDTIGVVVDDATSVYVGAAWTTPAFVLVYEAEKIIVPKIADTGIAFGIGDDVFFDAAEGKVTNLLTANTLCGRALEAADEDAVEVLVHLMVLTTPAGT